MEQLKPLLQEVQYVVVAGLVPLLLGGMLVVKPAQPLCFALKLSYHPDIVSSLISWDSSLVSILNPILGQ